MRLNGRPVMHFAPVEIEALGMRTSSSTRRSGRGRQTVARIEESWFDLRLAGTTDLVFTPQTRSFRATHEDKTFLAMHFDKMPQRCSRHGYLPSCRTRILPRVPHNPR